MHDEKREVRVQSGLTNRRGQGVKRSAWSNPASAVRLLAVALVGLVSLCGCSGPQTGGQSGTEVCGDQPFDTFMTVQHCACANAGSSSAVLGRVLTIDDVSARIEVLEALASAPGIEPPAVGAEVSGTLLGCAAGAVLAVGDDAVVLYQSGDPDAGFEGTLIALPASDPLVIGEIGEEQSLARDAVDTLVDFERCMEWVGALDPDADAGRSVITAFGDPTMNAPISCEATSEPGY